MNWANLGRPCLLVGPLTPPALGYYLVWGHFGILKVFKHLIFKQSQRWRDSVHFNKVYNSLRSKGEHINGHLGQISRGFAKGYELKTHEDVARAIRCAGILQNIRANWDSKKRGFKPWFHTRFPGRLTQP